MAIVFDTPTSKALHVLSFVLFLTLFKVPYEAFETIVPADNHLQLQDLTPAEQEILKNLI